MARSSSTITLIILCLHIDHHSRSPRSLCIISAASQASCLGSSGTLASISRSRTLRAPLSFNFISTRLPCNISSDSPGSHIHFDHHRLPNHRQRSSHPSRSICTSSSFACIYNTTPSTHTHGSVHTADTQKIIRNVHSHSTSSPRSFLCGRHDTTLRLSNILFLSV